MKMSQCCYATDCLQSMYIFCIIVLDMLLTHCCSQADPLGGGQLDFSRTIIYHTTCNLYHFIQIQELMIMILVSNIKYTTLLVNMLLLKAIFGLIYPDL